MLVILMCIFLASCSQKHDYIYNIDHVISKEAKTIYKEEGSYPIGYGGAMMNGIECIHLILVSHQRVDIGEARRMIIRDIERIHDAVNSKDNLKEHLIPYPFPRNKIELSILFMQKSGRFIEYGCVWLGTGGVSSVSQLNGKLFYSSFNPRTDLLEPYYNESYEEALAIVKSENNGICNPPDHPRINL